MEAELELARQHFLQGNAHFDAERFDEARSCFEIALKLAPGRPSVLANLGVTHFRLGHWQEAVPLLQQATAADPAQLDAWICLGMSHEALAQWQPAVNALTQALAMDPNRAGVWAAFGRCQLRLGLPGPALQAFDRAVTLDPELAMAWSDLGSLLREMNRLDDAARCFERAIALGADPELHAYYLASVRGDGAAAPPRKYVEGLFDDYAAEFESHLVGKLQYRGHEVLLGPLLSGGRRYRTVLDLGCGSGLCGALIAPHADAIHGVDVSAAMLEQARALGVYRELVHADLAPFLAATALRADLVVAADVFVYVGDLAEVFRSVRRILEPAGCFAFTLEKAAAGEDLTLMPNLRYAHSESYVRSLAAASGFAVRALFTATLRHGHAGPIAGLYAYLE